jgi:glycerol-3-phosphate dehydrogenase (NAD(P)+)
MDDVFDDKQKIVVLTGPNFAQQLAEKRHSASVVASSDKVLREEIKKLCTNNYFVCFCSDDVIGAQVGGALKNVIALFLGIINGSGYRENFLAFMFSAGFSEIVTIAEHLKCGRDTMYGISGLGDLVLGFLGKKNRNYELGITIGKGSSLLDISDTKKNLPEGVNTVKALYKMIKKNGLNLPIFIGTYKIIFQGEPIRKVVEKLMKCD